VRISWWSLRVKDIICLRMMVEGAALRGHAVEVFPEVVVRLEPPDRERHEDAEQHRHFDQPEDIVHLSAREVPN